MSADQPEQRYLRHPGVATRATHLQTLFLAVIIVLLFGTVNAAREFTKEIPVYKRERMVNLKVGPYVFSKVFVSALVLSLPGGGLSLSSPLITIDWPLSDGVSAVGDSST